jgi:hypothetical protein
VRDGTAVELLTRHRDFVAAHEDLAAIAMELEVAGADRRRSARRPRSAARLSPHDGSDTRDQLAHAEGFGDVVVCAALQPQYFVSLRVAGGDHQDRGVDIRTAVADRAAERHAVEAWQHHIEEHEVEACGARALERERAIGDLVNDEAGQAEMQPEQLASRSFVFDDTRAAT